MAFRERIKKDIEEMRERQNADKVSNRELYIERRTNIAYRMDGESYWISCMCKVGGKVLLKVIEDNEYENNLYLEPHLIRKEHTNSLVVNSELHYFYLVNRIYICQMLLGVFYQEYIKLCKTLILDNFNNAVTFIATETGKQTTF